MTDVLSIKLGTHKGLLRGTSATAWYERGCAAEAVDLAAAEACYRRAIAGRPDHADAHNNLGRLLHEMPVAAGGGAVAAEAHYRLALCASPDVALYWFNLGVAIEDQGRASEAIAAYERALAIDSSLADAHFNLARQYEELGRRTSDELTLHRAVRHLVRYRDLARVG
ncbi:MAG TPA: tetratricopeptide repeat protein [Kofleriaceae bacterium]